MAVRRSLSSSRWFALVYRRRLLQCGQQFLGTGGHRHRFLKNNVRSLYILAVQVFVGAVVGSQRGAGKGNTGEEPACPRIGQNFCPQGNVSLRRSGAANGPGGGRSVAPDLDLALQYVFCRTRRHERQNKSGGI